MKKTIFLILFFCFIALIYSNGTENYTIIYKTKAFVTEKNKTDVKKGENVLKFFNNDEGILKNTIFITFEKENFQNLSYKFIDNYVQEDNAGKKVKVYVDSKIIEGEIITNTDKLIIKTDNLIYEINKEKISYIEYPVKDSPTLTAGSFIVKFNSKEDKTTNINLNYFTTSLLWTANYNLIFDEEENELKADLSVNIKNQGNKNYKNCKIYVVSGDIKTDLTPGNYDKFLLKAARVQIENVESAALQKLSDFYEYDIKGIYDIESKQNTTIYIFKNLSINFNKEYIYNSSIDNEGVYAVFTLTNIKENNLGFPLPSGEASLFIQKNDILHFIGKDFVKDTPEKEKVELKSGRIFDIKVERKHLFTEKIANNVCEEKYSLIFKNYKDKKTRIRVLEKINSVYWEIRECSHNYKKIDTQTIEFEIDVEPQKSTEIIYKVRKKY